MEISIHGHNMEVTPRLKNYVEKKTVRLDRYMPNLNSVRVDLSAENARSAVERQVAQVTIRDDRGTILRAEERSNDIFAAIDTVVDKLYRQISRYQGKQKRKWRGEANEDMTLGEPLPIEEEYEEVEEQKIVRYKRFVLQPMAAEEAVEQMELLGHDFYVFFNMEDDAVNVLYKRHDGNYGLLQPEFD
ncbi:MAG: ribosome-associated translation inhibitor RaiA [Chloroflexota bacterium]|nr:ribosome-associated translation inhibitor RaiA [Anaerolineales bacterium]MCB8965704.1 ribosome-associated translation inhibitor RaiA [Ardenticatenaceae bacterium]